MRERRLHRPARLPLARHSTSFRCFDPEPARVRHHRRLPQLQRRRQCRRAAVQTIRDRSSTRRSNVPSAARRTIPPNGTASGVAESWRRCSNCHVEKRRRETGEAQSRVARVRRRATLRPGLPSEKQDGGVSSHHSPSYRAETLKRATSSVNRLCLRLAAPSGTSLVSRLRSSWLPFPQPAPSD